MAPVLRLSVPVFSSPFHACFHIHSCNRSDFGMLILPPFITLFDIVTSFSASPLRVASSWKARQMCSTPATTSVWSAAHFHGGFTLDKSEHGRGKVLMQHFLCARPQVQPEITRDGSRWEDKFSSSSTCLFQSNQFKSTDMWSHEGAKCRLKLHVFCWTSKKYSCLFFGPSWVRWTGLTLMTPGGPSRLVRYKVKVQWRQIKTTWDRNSGHNNLTSWN